MKEQFLRCRSCGRSGRTKKIPKACPICNFTGTVEQEQEKTNILRVMYEALTGNKQDKWYMICDQYCFVKGDEIPWPKHSY